MEKFGGGEVEGLFEPVAGGGVFFVGGVAEDVVKVEEAVDAAGVFNGVGGGGGGAGEGGMGAVAVDHVEGVDPVVAEIVGVGATGTFAGEEVGEGVVFFIEVFGEVAV